MEIAKLKLWDQFCVVHRIATRSVALFQSDHEQRVVVSPFGRDRRLILQRSAAMDELLSVEVERVLADPPEGGAGFEGLLYMMHWVDPDGRVLPLYIGRAGKYGRGVGNVSANLGNIRKNLSRFARWGSNYAYHIGDLSAASCPGHDSRKCAPKYTRWAQKLFADAPSANPQLRQPVFFWATAWGPTSYSIWPDFGACSLSFEEYLLIGVASELFPTVLLNEEGVNRRPPMAVRISS